MVLLESQRDSQEDLISAHSADAFAVANAHGKLYHGKHDIIIIHDAFAMSKDIHRIHISFFESVSVNFEFTILRLLIPPIIR